MGNLLGKAFRFRHLQGKSVVHLKECIKECTVSDLRRGITPNKGNNEGNIVIRNRYYPVKWVMK